MFSSARSFIIRLYRFNPKLLSLSFLLTLILSLFEGISLVSLLPILSLTGIFHNSTHTRLDGIMNYVGVHNLTLLNALSVFIFLIAISAYLKRQQSLLINKIQQGFISHLTFELYQLLATTTWVYWISKTKSDINHTLTHEIMRVSMGCYFLFQLLINLSMLLIYLVLSFAIAPELTLLIMLFGSALLFFLAPLVRGSRRAGVLISQHSRQLLFSLMEHLNGIKEVKTYGVENQNFDYLRQIRLDVEESNSTSVLLQTKVEMIYKIVAAVFISLVFYVAIKILDLNLERLLFILLIFAKIWPRISSVQTSLHSVAISLPAFLSIQTLEDEIQANQQIQNDSSSKVVEIENIVFEQVSFYFPNQVRATLENINFSFKRGEFIACIGESGAGKSTLADILLGLLKPTTGQVIVNGNRLADVQDSWQQLIGYVPQDVFLFNGTIQDNLCWITQGIAEDEILNVLDLVQLSELIKKLPNGLQTNVGERGINLSGGERQRLVLARVLLRRPKILILDEASSALDEKNNQLIQKSLCDLKGKLTLFVITHCRNSLMHADKVITLYNGKIAQIDEV